MKKFIFVLLLSLFFMQDINANDYIHNKFNNEIANDIKTKLVYNIEKHKQSMLWDENKIDIATKVLFIGEIHYGIKVEEILALISLESYFNIYAVGKNKYSKDYGLTQQNSLYIYKRYQSAAKVLCKHKIEYSIINKFDIALNLMSCILFKRTINTVVNKRTIKIYPKHVERIVAYNLGLGGARIKNRQKIGWRYYRIYKKRVQFCMI